MPAPLYPSRERDQWGWISTLLFSCSIQANNHTVDLGQGVVFESCTQHYAKVVQHLRMLHPLGLSPGVTGFTGCLDLAIGRSSMLRDSALRAGLMKRFFNRTSKPVPGNATGCKMHQDVDEYALCPRKNPSLLPVPRKSRTPGPSRDGWASPTRQCFIGGQLLVQVQSPLHDTVTARTEMS